MHRLCVIVFTKVFVFTSVGIISEELGDRKKLNYTIRTDQERRSKKGRATGFVITYFIWQPVDYIVVQ